MANWAAYNQALVRRGDVTVWVSSEAIAAWTPGRSGRRGGQRRYSDLATETALTLRLLYHLPLRQAEGFLHALFWIMRLDLSVPDYTTQGVRTAVNRYNQAVRAHNERVRANRRRLASELARLNSKPTITTTSYTVYHTSVRTLQRSYGLLETAADSQQLDARYNRLLDLSEREAANSAEVTNRILGDQAAAAGSADELEDAELLE